MQDYIYSSIAFLAMVIHLIINSNLYTDRRVTALHGSREYRSFLHGVFAYYLVDASWGVLAGLGWAKILYLDTMLYFIAIAVSVLLWCRFAVIYLDYSQWKARLLTLFGYALLTLYVVLLAANFYNGWLFRFDEMGDYNPGPLRPVLFYPLVGVNVVMAVFALVKVRGSQNSEWRRNLVIFLFCISMVVAIVFQVIWPLWPYYALGCLIGNCFLHIFVIEDERDELRQAIIEREQTAKHIARLEDALNRARIAEKSRSMFFSIVSHDIRTPLNAILGYSEILQYGVKSKEERDEALQSIRASGTTLLQLVNDVLDLAKMDSEKMTLLPEPVNLSHLTDEVFASFRLAASGKGIELINRADGIPTIMLDEHRFRQILFNLIGNAVKFTAQGSVTVAASYSDKNLEVSVTDTGCGIPSDMLTHILEPFVQILDPSHAPDRSRGTGLGLSICKRLVDVMGGKIMVESELGKGSTFRIAIPNIPAHEEKTAPAAAPKSSAEVKNLPKHVLIVDDSPVNRAVLTAFLTRAGVASIDQAGDGVEALKILDSAVNEGRPHDFIFSDFWMPNMNGSELVGKLRADPRFRQLPVFAVTADTEFQRDARTILFTGILFKPVTYDKILEAFACL